MTITQEEFDEMIATASKSVIENRWMDLPQLVVSNTTLRDTAIIGLVKSRTNDPLNEMMFAMYVAFRIGFEAGKNSISNDTVLAELEKLYNKGE